MVGGPKDIYFKHLLERAAFRGGPFISFNKCAPMLMAIVKSPHLANDAKLRYVQLLGPHHWEVASFDPYPQRIWKADDTPLVRECSVTFRPSVYVQKKTKKIPASSLR